MATNNCKPFKNVVHSLAQKLRRKDMPTFTSLNWNGYKIKIWPSDPMRMAVYHILRCEFIPYLCEVDIVFDIRIQTPRKFDRTEIINYHWELWSREKESIIDKGEGIFKGEGTFQFTNIKPSKKARKATTGDMIQPCLQLPFSKTVFRKLRAINLECVSGTDHYEIKMRFTNIVGISSVPEVGARFVIKDREDFNIQLVLLLVGAFAGLVCAVIGGVIGYIFGAW
jgi:hypothetical protein